MTTISQTATSAEAHATSKAHARNFAIDRTRTFLTIIVLIHHAVIPYTYFGHTDPKFSIVFDVIVLCTDSFFMAMFFFLSGLFVWPSLSRKSPGSFFVDRLLRLGLPFVIAAFTIIPIAYYALELQQHHPAMGFADFWWKMITVGPWPSGPLWFLWVLLSFDLTACLLYRLSPRLLDPINRLSIRGFDRPRDFFLVMLAVTMILYVSSRLYFGVNHWFEFGPFAVQASRIFLYASYFFIGAGIGAANFERGLLSASGQLAKSGWGWIVATLIPYCLLWVLIYIKREILGNPSPLPHWYEFFYGIFFATFSAAILFAILAFFLRFKRTGWSVLDPLQRDAYGIFLVHYAFALWIQYWLFNVDLPAIIKVLIGFAFTLATSWALTTALRKIPGSQRVL
jgi:surface polysaccharide O-acyltransferase-like enzyme